MKRFLFSLVALVVTNVCFAQDIIVQKYGSTIQAKVLKVSQSEVEYKKFSNQNGPTYTISTRDLQCINYENGTKDTFVSPNYNPNIVTNETATQFSNDQQLLKNYDSYSILQRKANKVKNTALIGGGILTIGGLALIAAGGVSETNIIGGALACVGVIGGATLYCYGYSIQKRMQRSIYSSTIFKQEFIVGKNNRLMVGVDMLKDNTRKNQTLGLGVSYNF